MTISRKILLFTFILLPVIVLAVFSFLQTRERLIRDIFQERRALASVSASLLKEKLDRLSDIGISLASRPILQKEIKAQNWEAAINVMEKVPQDFPYIDNLLVTDTAGAIKAEVPKAGIKDKVKTFTEWQKSSANKNRPYLSGVYADLTGQPETVSSLSVPVKSETGQLIAILVLEVFVDKLLESSSQVLVGNSGFVYIVDQRGRIAINPEYPQAGTITDYSSVPSIQKALSGQKNVEVLYNPIEKEDRLSAYEKVPGYNWAVVVQQNADKALAINKSLWPVLFFFSLVILLAAFLAWYIIRGITQQNEIQTELSKYIDIVEHTHVVIRNMDDEIIFWNKGMEELYGWKKNEVVGKKTHTLFNAKFPKPLGDITADLLKNNYWQGELKHSRKDGTTIYVSSHWQLQRNAAGNPEMIIETNNDITEVKVAREKLRRSEEGMLMLINNVKDYAIISLDLNGNITSWNNGAESIKGYKEAEVAGKHFSIFYTAEDIAQNKPAHNLEMAKKSGHYQQESWRVRKGGTLFYADVVFTALKDEAGELYGYSKITRDTTEKKKAQEQLEILSKQINQANDAIYTLDANRKITSWNLGAQNVYGFTAAEVIGKDSNEILSTEISHEEMNAALKQIEKQNYWTGELKRKTKDGKDIYVRSSSTTIRDQKGNIAAYVAVSFDITEQKKLQQQVSHLASIVEQSSEAILSIDPAYRIISWNKGAEKLFGFTKEEALGKTAAELGFIKVQPGGRQELEKDLQQKSSWETETLYYHKNGSSFYGAVTANLVKNELDQSTSVVFIIKDISLRKKLEEQLKQSNEELEEKIKLRTAEIVSSEKRFRSLIENSTDVITMMDKSFNLIYRSPAAERITGWSNEDMINVDATRNIHPDDVVEARAIVGEVMANPGRQYHTVFRNLHKNGHYIWMEGVLTNWLDDTNVNAIVFNYRDVTAQKEAQEKLVESEERYRSTLDNMLEGVQIIDFDWKYMYVNEALAKHSKYTTAQLIGHTVMEVFPGIEQTEIYKTYQRCFNERVPIHLENEFVFPDKSVNWFELSFQPVSQGIFILSVDITERKKAEEKLNEQRAQLQTLSDNLPGVMIYQIAGETQQNKRFTYVSNGVAQLTGNTPEEVMKNPALLYGRIVEDDISIMQAAEKKAYQTMTILNVEVRFLSASDGIRWLNIVSTPRKLNNGDTVWDGFHVDITESKNIAETIKKSEEHYRLLVEQSADGIFLADATGRYIDVNTAGCKMLGYTHDELVKKTILDIIIKEEYPQLDLAIESYAGGAIVSSEWHFIRKDGSIFIGEVIGRQFNDGRMQGILRDVTERKQAEEKLSISEERFRSIVNQYPSPITRYAPDGTFITANPAWEIMWEDKTLNVAGYNIRKDPHMVSSGISVFIEKAFNGEVALSDAFEYDPALIGKTGRKRWIQMLIYPLNDSNGKLIEVIVITLDITENKEAETKLIASEKRFRNSLDNMLEGVQIHDLNWRYTYVNDTLTKYSKYSKEELIGYTLMEKYPGIEKTALFKTLERCMSEQVSEHLETEFIFPDGSKTFFELSIQPVPEGLFMLSVDISERKRADELVKQLNIELEERVISRTEQLKRSNEEMEAFTYSVSHDLRAPLRGILGFTSILEEDYGARLDAEAQRITSVIKNNTIKMGNLIDDLLAFSKIGRQQLEKSPINTTELVKQIISAQEFKTKVEKVEWILPSLHNAKGDINTIRQVWINLISNAVKYSSGKPQQRVEIGSYEDEANVVFFVKDNGVGFDQKYSDKLFKVFQRLHDANDFEGTGVGLAIVEKIISKHGGNVWAEAVVGNGATFYFSLPNDADDNN